MGSNQTKMIHLLWKQTAVELLDRAEDVSAKQAQELNDGLDGNPLCLTCFKCEEKTSVFDLYRCFFCDLWFCSKCSSEHFEQQD